MRIDRRSVLAGVAASAASGVGRAAASDLREDGRLLREIYGALHPGLLRYQSRSEAAACFDRLERELAASRDRRGAYLALTRLTAAVRCGHSFPNPANQTDAALADLQEGRRGLPFEFRWIGTGMGVTRDLSAEGVLPPGSLVTEVDGVPTAALQRRLLPLARADGSNDGKRRSLLELRGRERYETTDLLLPLVLSNLKDEATFRLASGRRVRATLLTAADRSAARAARPADGAPPWTFDIDADGVAVLRMESWAVYNSTFDWRGWLNARLDALASERARGFVVDLRGNEGGLDCGNLILARLVKAEFALPQDQRFLRYRRVPDAFRPYLDTWNKTFYDWGDQVEGPDARGFYQRRPAPDAATAVRPEGSPFRGPVAVLCDASNSSATFNFAAFVRRSGVAVLIGETTGGNQRGINGAGYFFVRLPGTGLEVDLPLIAAFPAGRPPDAGLEPDVPVALRASDLTGPDRVLALARRRVLA